MDGEPKPEEAKAAEGGADGGDSDEESGEDDRDPEEIKKDLLEACRENNEERTEELLGEKGCEVVFEIEGWSPILWAACNGNENICRMLINRGACAPYMNQSKQLEGTMESSNNNDEEPNAFIKQPDPKKFGKYTPLHWASYKGFYKVSWLLLKIGMSPLDVDQYGNTAVHQAAASKSIDVLKCFLAQGVDVNLPNARNHSPLHLATEQGHKALISKAMKTEKCENCGSKFDFKNIRYYCESSDKFYCVKCCKRDWMYESWDSEEKERPVCRGLKVLEKIQFHEEDLKRACDEDEFFTLDKALNGCHGVDIDVKLKKKGEDQHLRLEHELRIRNFLKDHTHHETFKAIRKDVQKINEMVETAQGLDIDLDPVMITEVNQFTSRLVSERNLRKKKGLYNDEISTSKDAQVNELRELIDTAKKNNVEEVYVNEAEKLTGQMAGNIESRNILGMFLDYPEREWPEEEELDPKKAKDKKAKPKKKKKIV